MADIELVIRIPEELISEMDDENYQAAISWFDTTLYRALKDSTVLPKGHGDLIDRSKICKAIPAEEDNCTGVGMTYDEMNIYNDGINSMWNKLQNADPIIEADKGGER